MLYQPCPLLRKCTGRIPRISGVISGVLVFLVFCMLNFRDGPFRRPHPAFWLDHIHCSSGILSVDSHSRQSCCRLMHPLISRVYPGGWSLALIYCTSWFCHSSTGPINQQLVNLCDTSIHLWVNLCRKKVTRKIVNLHPRTYGMESISFV